MWNYRVIKFKEEEKRYKSYKEIENRVEIADMMNNEKKRQIKNAEDMYEN